MDVTLEKERPVEDERAGEPDEGRAPSEGPRRPRRTLWSDLRRALGTPARRGRVALYALVLAAVVAGPLLARAGVSEARVEVRAQGAERSGAADARAGVEAAEDEAAAEESAAADLAAQARAAHNEQRHRLAFLGLNEQTIDDFLVAVDANAALVEFRRDRVTADVDRQAAEIPQMQECRRVAAQTINRAFNLIFDPNAPVPAPSDLCQALLAAGT
ncbi:MAG TPA: hypothetical protein VF228_21050 [Iamia sp.]